MSGNPFTTLVSALNTDKTKTYPEARELMAALTRMGQFQTGTVTGTGAALDVDVNGDPKVVIAFNTNNACMGIKISGMADKFAAKIVTAGNLTYADEMITLGTGKFSFGTDANLNSAHTIIWLAVI